MKIVPYRYEAGSVRGFVQQLAVQYIPHGYWFYVTGHVPPHKDPARTDAKLLHRYGIAVSKWTRLRRKRTGQSAMHYLRLGRFFVLVASHGQHPFFALESTRVRDLRRVPLKAFGYALSLRRGRACVRIDREEFRRLEVEFAELARFGTAEQLAFAFAALPFEPYAPVHQQLRRLWRQVNAHRRLAGRPALPVEVVPWRRRIVHPFASDVEVSSVESTSRMEDAPGCTTLTRMSHDLLHCSPEPIQENPGE